MSYTTNVIRVLTTVEVDANTINDYLIGVTPPGTPTTRFCPLILSIEAVEVTGVGGGATYPTMSVGTNSPNFDNWFNAATLPPLALNETILTGVGGVALPPSVPRGTDVYARISVAAVDITTYRLRVSLTGIWYQDGGIGP